MATDKVVQTACGPVAPESLGRVGRLVALVRTEWATRLLLSSDRCHRPDLRAFGGRGLRHRFHEAFDMLCQRGLSDGDLGLLTVEYPRHLHPWRGSCPCRQR